MWTRNILGALVHLDQCIFSCVHMDCITCAFTNYYFVSSSPLYPLTHFTGWSKCAAKQEYLMSMSDEHWVIWIIERQSWCLMIQKNKMILLTIQINLPTFIVWLVEVYAEHAQQGNENTGISCDVWPNIISRKLELAVPGNWIYCGMGHTWSNWHIKVKTLKSDTRLYVKIMCHTEINSMNVLFMLWFGMFYCMAFL